MSPIGIIASSINLLEETSCEGVGSTGQSLLQQIILTQSPDSFFDLSYRRRWDPDTFRQVLVSQNPDSRWQMSFCDRDWLEPVSITEVITSQSPDSQWSLSTRDRTDGLTYDETVISLDPIFYLPMYQMDHYHQDYDDLVVSLGASWYLPTLYQDADDSILNYDDTVACLGPVWYLPTYRHDDAGGTYDEIVAFDSPKALWLLNEKTPIDYGEYDVNVITDSPKAFWKLDSIDEV